MSEQSDGANPDEGRSADGAAESDAEDQGDQSDDSDDSDGSDASKPSSEERAEESLSNSPTSSSIRGRLLSISAAEVGIQTRAMLSDLEDGSKRSLWTTATGANTADWQLSPNTEQLAYRQILRSSPREAIETLVVRDLDVGSAAEMVAAADTDTTRLAGYAWSADSSALAYGRQVGGLLKEQESPLGIPPIWGAACCDCGRCEWCFDPRQSRLES